MATTSVEICNLALFRVRAEEIGDLNEQSVNAEKCRVLYPHCRDIVLTEFPWGFARSVRSLSKKTGETATEWEYVFDYPNDCLKARYLIPVDSSGEAVYYHRTTLYDIEPIEFETSNASDGSQVILTNYEFVKLVYTKAVTNPTLWDTLVDDMIAWRLAMDLAIPLGGDSGKFYRDNAEKNYLLQSGVAQAKVSNEQWPRKAQSRPRAIQARNETVLSRDELIYRRGY